MIVFAVAGPVYDNRLQRAREEKVGGSWGWSGRVSAMGASCLGPIGCVVGFEDAGTRPSGYHSVSAQCMGYFSGPIVQ